MPRAKQRGKRDGSKSAAVREYLQKHPTTKPGDVVKALKAEGVDVSYNLVSTLKGKALTVVGNKNDRPKSATNGSAARSEHDIGNGIPPGENGIGNGFFAAIEFIRTAGGIDNAKQILEQISIIKSL